MIIILSAILWRLGGWDKARWHGYRIILVPIVLGLWVWYKYHNVIAGFLTIGAMQVIRIGYGAYDPEHDDKPSFLAKITHDRKGFINRAIVGLLYGFIGGLPVAILMHNFCYYIFYGLFNGFIGFVFSYLKAKDYIIEPAIGATVALI